MFVGMTYDLRSEYLARGYSEEETAEFDREDTVIGLETALAELGHQPVRIGSIDALVKRLAQGERFDLVFNIAEGLHGLSRESQVPALLEAYAIPYTFSDPTVLGICLHKGLAKTLARASGVRTADFMVVERVVDLERFDLPFPVFAKPIAEGTSKGISGASVVKDRGQLETVCATLLARFRQPVLLETWLSGREFTVGITGTGADAESIGVMEVSVAKHTEDGTYSFDKKKDWLDTVSYALVHGHEDPEVREAERVGLAAWRALGCRDGGRVDVRSDAAGVPNFLEVNPLAGLNPEISDLCILCTKAGLRYVDLIGRIVNSALARRGP